MRMQQSVSSVASNHTSARRPTVNLMGFALAGDGLARVVVEVTHNKYSRDEHQLVSESMSDLFENKLAAVAGSFQSVDRAPYTERIAGVVRVNTQCVPVSESLSGFRSVSSNIFMDDEEKMWVLRKTESGDILVKNTGIEDHESLRHLLELTCSGGYSLSSDLRATIAQASHVQQSVTAGDYVQYVSAHSGETRFGFVAASAEEDKLIVLPADVPESEGEVVHKEAVVAAYDTQDFPDVTLSEQEEMDTAVAAARGVVDINHILSYYRKVFARSGNFYAEFEKRARQHSFM